MTYNSRTNKGTLMGDFIRCFNDWKFWMTQEILDPDEIRNQTGTTMFIDGKSYQVFWTSVNCGMIDMFWERLDT
jgi:hypothetical protein